MSERRRGLGRGLGALIPTEGGAAGDNPAHQTVTEVFFPSYDPSVDQGWQSDPAPQAEREDADVPSRTSHDAGREIDLREGGPRSRSPRESARREGGTRSGEALLPVPGARFAEIPVGAIAPNPRQPRREFDDDAHRELVHSVREVGVLQPVIVRPAEGGGRGGAEYELVMGERRWRASQDAGLAVIPAIVRDTHDDDLLRDALLENLHRSQLNPLEEAAAYQQLLDDFGCTHDNLAQRVGRSRPQISNTIRLLRLPPLVQRRVAAGVLSAGHARALLGLGDGAAMERLAQRIVAEGLSVRTTEEIVAMGGEGSAATRAPRRPAGSAPAERALSDLGARLSDRFETRVQVSMGQRKGKLTVEFASVDDLNRILGALAPEDPGVDETQSALTDGDTERASGGRVAGSTSS